jgi:predicted acetyltransferase
MDIEIRKITEQEIPAYGRSLERTFGEVWTEQDWEAERPVFELDRCLAAFDGPDLVGTTGAYSLTLTVPGESLPMAGVTTVSVQPSHRRRGILTQMMRRQLDDLHDQGEPIAGLWASESSIYGRFGYGMAAPIAELRIERDRSAFIRPHHPAGRVRLVEKDEALKEFPAVFDRVARERPGMWARTDGWWKRTVADLERWREGASPLFFVLHESTQGVDGYAMYRVKREWKDGLPASTVRVREHMAETPDAYADLWRFLFDIDLVRQIEAYPRPVDEALPWMLAEPRRLSMSVTDGMWLRLVDLPSALAARRYWVAGRVVFDVKDTFCPWVDGRYELVGGPDGAECRPTDRPADVVLAETDLAAAYLGGVRFSLLRRAGRIEGDPDTLQRADAMFAWEPLPWCHQEF